MQNYVFILSGGSGTRFWPLSTNKKPKQLLNLFGEKSMLEMTSERITSLTNPENQFVLTNHIQRDSICELKELNLPKENIISEPQKRDTAPAIALALGLTLAKSRGQNAVMAILPADHYIKEIEKFQSIVKQAIDFVKENNCIATIGIAPTFPCTSYGYIELDDSKSSHKTNNSKNFLQVKSFHEKPDILKAKNYLEKGNFVWNAGMFFWTTKTLLEQLNSYAPQLAEFAEVVAKQGGMTDAVKQKFIELEPISIDYALMEKADNIFCLPADFNWDDIGNWNSLANHLPAIEKGNSKNFANTNIVSLDSNNNIIHDNSGKTTALIGVNNLIIVRTKDSLLIANREKTENIKKIIDQLPENLT